MCPPNPPPSGFSEPSPYRECDSRKPTWAKPAFVIGLGLIGQLTVALLKAAGCRVIGTDLDASRCQQAEQMGVDMARPNLTAADVESLTGGLGADVVLITASTSSNQPIELAASAVRKKGRIVLVGVVGVGTGPSGVLLQGNGVPGFLFLRSRSL